MFQSDLHQLLVKALNGIKWTRTTKYEDNFRHIICSSLYDDIAPSNIEIPSTTSGQGDIKIFGRKIELKFASELKREKLSLLLEDFDLLLDGKIEFAIISIKLSTKPGDWVLHRTLELPVITTTNHSANFGDHTALTPAITYKGISIFLPAAFVHEEQEISLFKSKRTNVRGRKCKGYLSFENSLAINRSSLLDTPKGNIHVDVIGSKEDGLISYVFKRADNIQTTPIANTKFDIEIPAKSGSIKIGECQMVTISSISKKIPSGLAPHYKSQQQPSIPSYKIHV